MHGSIFGCIYLFQFKCGIFLHYILSYSNIFVLNNFRKLLQSHIYAPQVLKLLANINAKPFKK
jgi:hypothetical protein